MADDQKTIALDMFNAADECLETEKGNATHYLLAAQAHATLALVEATERLAKAQETANIIARQVWATNVALAVGEMAPEVLEAGSIASDEIARRLSEYIN